MKQIRLFALGITVLALSSCQTWDGVMQDVGGLDLPTLDSSSAPVDRRADTLVTNADCPVIEVVDELSVYNEFAQAAPQQPALLISSAAFGPVQSSCSFTPKSVTVDLKLTVQGQRGQQSGTTAPIPYPYFVAVTDPGGDIMAKEVFTAPINYASGQTTFNDTLRQIIPIPDRSRANRYKVLVGFQLNKDQLTLNRAEIQRRFAAQQAAEEAARAAAKAAASAQKNAPKGPAAAQLVQPVQTQSQPAQIVRQPNGGIVIPDDGQPVPLSPAVR